MQRERERGGSWDRKGSGRQKCRGSPKEERKKEEWRDDRHRCKSLLSSQRKKQTGRWRIRWNETLKIRGPERDRKERDKDRSNRRKKRDRQGGMMTVFMGEC